MAFTRSRPSRKNDQGHIGQKNLTNVRLWFGYGRPEHPELLPVVNVLCRGPLDQLPNWLLPTMKLEKKELVGNRMVRHCGRTQTARERMPACAEFGAETKARLRAEKAAQKPFAVRREADLQLKVIEAVRRPAEP